MKDFNTKERGSVYWQTMKRMLVLRERIPDYQLYYLDINNRKTEEELSEYKQAGIKTATGEDALMVLFGEEAQEVLDSIRSVISKLIKKMNSELNTAYQLMSIQTGGKIDIYKILSKLPRAPWSKYKGEKHLPSYNFLGAQTNLNERLDANDNPHPHSTPINRVDAAAYRHDLAYRNAGDDLSKKHQADR